MIDWVRFVLPFFPLCLVVSLVCTSMKEDRLGVIALRGLRLCLSLTVGIALFTVAVFLLMWVVL